MSDLTTRLDNWLAAAATAPPPAEQPFIHGEAAVGDIYAMAGDLQSRFDDIGEKRTICLCTNDRALAAAAVLASLDGDTRLLLPHASSPGALAAMHRAIPFAAAVADGDSRLPEGVVRLQPSRGGPRPIIRGGGADWIRLFTGGSTGAPKVWPKSPLNLLGEALFQSDHHRIGPGDTIVATVSPMHIYGLLFSVLVPLVSGAALVPGTPAFPAEIASGVEGFAATLVVSVPVHYRTLGDGPRFGGTLRRAFSSAGPLSPEDGAAFTRRTGTPVMEIYGSTETGGIATRCRAAGETAYTPFPVIDWRITDDRLSIRSAFLSGSLPTDADGYYQTPDRVHPTAGGGGFEVGRRTDNVIKVGGKRVDLGAVHETLMQVAGVTHACVLALPVGGGRETAIAALVETHRDRTAVMAALATALEPQEMPRRLRTVPRMPMTAAGKVDRTMAAQLLNATEGDGDA